jgi:D-alanyl-lipoteichoic acid acyltransferase DltB (MBOAT superfamily)
MVICVNVLSNSKLTTPPNIRKFILILGVLFNLGLLGYFKYTDFFIENVNALFGTNCKLLHILLPLGISFFTFQQLAFVVDCYKGKEAFPKFLDYCNFVTFFPQLIAGPIVLPEEMLPQFESRTNLRPQAKNLFDGLFIFSLGLVKKVFIADSIAVFANAGYSLDLVHYTMAEAWLISLSYTFQLYFDFSGYCDMAIGIHDGQYRIEASDDGGQIKDLVVAYRDSFPQF